VGKLIVTEFITLDGVVEDPGGAEGTPFGGWSIRFSAPGSQEFKFEELQAGDVQLLGRVTYEEFASAWPAMEEVAGEFGKKMNGMPKVVVSTTLTEATWKNSTIVSGDLPGTVKELKSQYTGDILVAGSPTLVNGLRADDLVDEYRLMVYPIVVGQGKRLFDDRAPGTSLELVSSRSFGDVALLTYRPAPAATDNPTA
jgi:dihydrofolate reductase